MKEAQNTNRLMYTWIIRRTTIICGFMSEKSPFTSAAFFLHTNKTELTASTQAPLAPY